MKNAVLLACIALAIAPGSAAAQTYGEALPMSASNPADAGHFDPTSNPVPWEVDGSVKNTQTSLHIEVSTKSTLGPDGTLDPASLVDSFSLYETFDGSGIYSGQSVGGAGRWQDTPGTYYWMAYAEFHSDPNDFSSPVHYYRSKVFTIHVGAAPADPSPSPAGPATPAAAPLTQGAPAARPATSLRVYSHSIVHGHAKLIASCTSAPCTLRTVTVVTIGSRKYPATIGSVTLTNSIAQHVYLSVAPGTLRAIRRAAKHHRAARVYVGVFTLDRAGAVADVDYATWRIRRAQA